MILALTIAGIIILLLTLAGVICYYTLAVPNRKPLTEVEREICRRLIEERKAYPFVCAQAVKSGQCPCLPCAKLGQERRKD